MKKYAKVIFLISFMAFISFSAFTEGNVYQISKEAELKSITIYQKNVRSDSKEILTMFDITVKNITTSPRKYNLVCIVDGKGAGEASVPGDEKATVPPGTEAKETVAVMMNEFPGNFTIIVETVQ